MCRLLLVKSENEFEITPHLKKFAEVAKNSTEYQGDGWGCAFIKNHSPNTLNLFQGEQAWSGHHHWRVHKNIIPIWEDDLDRFGNTTLLLAHARSASKNQDIKVETNMPFYNNNYVFIFNGELYGVKIKESGRVGAEKIFNYIMRFYKSDMLQALKRGIEIIKKRTRYIKAMNIILSDNKKQVYLASIFSENPDYFTIYFKQSNNELVICSEKYPNEENWEKIENNTIRAF